MPYEWHKVLNSRGLSLGAAFRVIDTAYLASLARPSISANLPFFEEEVAEDVAHLLTSLKYASLHLNRAQMMLNDSEHIYPVLLKPCGGVNSRREAGRLRATRSRTSSEHPDFPAGGCRAIVEAHSTNRGDCMTIR
jgi:hypothetical protein